MRTGSLKKIGTTFLLTPALLIATLPAGAQELHRRGDDNGRNDQRNVQRYDQRNDRRDYDRHDDRRYRAPEHYRGGSYGYYGAPSGYVTYAPAYRGDGYYVQDNGIGPGKGAAIGAVGGAILGALVGGGKGAVIGGAAGAGVGAIAGQAAQDNRYNNQYGYYGR